ncbi:hypothetical protein ANCCAN_17958 [Ancylostoma caninum]|uniref:SXP/RAL-2 family protein Ani s 5-like cation-binding domain-containing protein n=1 Tax=Ancylostoma caninum TaxID=29170 RepID=A0A368G0Q1_ANCCA|nr:hypothetical protein ANCCAN_17958 [Ancylostoma caninum]
MLLLLLLGFVAPISAHWWWPPYPRPPGPPPRPGPPGPASPFPFPIPPGSQRELYDIQNDPNLTRQQYEDKMKQWAAKYGVKDQFDAYKKDIRNQRKKAQKELDEALDELPKYYKELRKIDNDKSLTAAQAAQKKKELFDKLTPKQKQAAQQMENIFAPDFAKRAPPRPPHGPRPGPYWPYGPYGYW